MYVCLCCVCVLYLIPVESREEEEDCGPQKLELKIAMRGYVGAGNGALVLWKNKQCSELLSHLTRFQSPCCRLNDVQHLQGLLLCVKGCHQHFMDRQPGTILWCWCSSLPSLLPER